MLRRTTLLGPRRSQRFGTAVAGLLLGIASVLVVSSPVSAVGSGEVEISDSADPVNAGDRFTYTVTAKAPSTDICPLGCSTLLELTLTNGQPIAMITAVNGSGCSITNGGLRTRCLQFPVPADTIVSMTVTIQTTTSGVLTTEAHWTGDGDGFFEDFDTETTTIGGGGADLSTSLTDVVDPAALGQTITYVKTIANGGDQAASDVTAALSLSGSSAMIVSATPSQGSCTITATSVSCALGGLADSASATVTVVAEPQATGSVTATATASATETDPDMGNNAAIETTAVNNSLGCTIIGTSGNDTLNGSNDNDVICGLGGNDTINGGNGDDVLYGGDGDDIMGGGNGADYLYGQAGNDTNYGETLLGSLLYLFDNGADHIYGGPGNDDLNGQNGNDVLADTEGTDTMSGGLGNDSINVQDGASGDTANGGLGNDTCTTDPGDTTTSC